MTIPKPEFPRPERERKQWLNLNGSWDFMLFPEGKESQERSFASDRTGYTDSIQVPFTWTCPLSGVGKDTSGIGWYRKYVNFPVRGRCFLCVGAADYLADVYVNGNHIGQHEGGYSYFEFDVTDAWKDGLNMIEIRAEDYRRETQLYGKQGYGELQGIWQTVWLEERPLAYIRDFRTVTRMNGEITFTVTTSAPDGTKLNASFEGNSGEARTENGSAVIRLRLASPRLWSPDDPYLYEGTLSLGENGEKDEIHTYFGVREIGSKRFDGHEFPWITLNDKPVYLNGTLDQSFNPKGYFTYPDEKEIRLEAWRLKRLGLNMVRIHIKPEEPRKLYWMDKLGILVMEDIPCFWGPPVREAREAYEKQWPEIISRDMNHPSIFAWVMFNESWGLLHKEWNDKVYLPETQEWVRGIWRSAKAMDPTRIVEDNSPCRNDHVETDINTWHFYINGYEKVRDHIREVVNNTFPGSGYNYIGGNVQNNAPLMNSECGLVWGVDHSAGDSDLAWHYHYMMNEFRLHEKLCGFVFTEFHDVVNEFNGYYRINGEDKDFGYQDFCTGMSLRDLHASDWILTDCPPVQDVQAGQRVHVPLRLSSFSDELHGQRCACRWELWHDGLNGRVTDDAGTEELPGFGYGVTVLPDMSLTMPSEDAAEILSLYLVNAEGKVVSRNFTTFNVHADAVGNIVHIPVSAGKAEGFANVWQAMRGQKLCLGGRGTVSFSARIPEADSANEMCLYLEASSKRVLSKDCTQTAKGEEDLGFMRGYRVDRGAFENSYWMTDETRYPSEVEVIINGEVIDRLHFDNDWADARGILSWNSQKNDRRLDEAGSFGEQKRIVIPSRLIPDILREKTLTFSLRVVNDGGLAIYDRESGRYAHGIELVIS